MNDLTLIIPAKNESESLPKVLDAISNLDYKIIISLDKTDYLTIKSIENFKNKKNITLFYQSGAGYGNSLREAIYNCKTKYFCIFNADGSFNHKDLPEMFYKIKDNDFIFATRYEYPGGSEDDTIITYVGNKIFSFLGRILFSLNITDILYTYILGKTESFKNLAIKSDDFRFCVELPIKMKIAKMKYISIPSFETKRIAGVKKVNNFKDGFLILIKMISLFFNFKILRKKNIDS